MQSTARSPQLGHVVGGKYRLIRALGGGRGSDVFEAEHLWTGKRFALKVLAAGSASALETRFVREARAASALVHPNVVKVYDVDRDSAGTLFQVQELLRGRDLSELLKSEKKLSLDTTLDLLLPVMDALALAHDVGVVHRDVRPGNVFVSQRTDGAIVPKLIDFGVSKLVGAAAGNEGAITAEGVMLGAVGYKPPELLSAVEEADAAADVWAMAVTLYEALSGAPPFSSRSQVDLTIMIVSRDAPHLWERAPELPPAFAAVIDRALVRDRKQRLTDMTVFVAELCESVGRALPEGAETIIDALAAVEVDTDALPTPTSIAPVPALARRPDHEGPQITFLRSTGSTRHRLRLGMVGDPDAADVAEQNDLLDRALGAKSAIVRLPTYADLVDALAEQRVDLAWLAPMAYARARSIGAVGLFEIGRDDRQDARAILLGRAPRVRTLEHLAGARVAWVDPWSTSGFALQRRALRERGIDPSVFGEQAFLGSHEAVGVALESGRADVGGIVGFLDKEKNEITGPWPAHAPVVVLTMSETIPNEVVAVGPSVATLAPQLSARLSGPGLVPFTKLGHAIDLRPLNEARYSALAAEDEARSGP